MLVASLVPPFPYFQAPAGTALARVVPGGTTILPNGRLLTPHGRRLYVGEDLWAVALSPDGGTLVAASDDLLTLYTDLAAARPTKRVLAVRGLAPALAFAQDGRTLYVSLGDKGGVAVVDVATLARGKDLPLPTEDGYLSALAVGPKGLLAADATNGRLSLIDPATGRATTVAAGRQPYALEVSGSAVFVANIGVFDYSPIPKPREGEGSPKGLSRPAFAFPSREAEEGVEAEGRRVPGLGKVGGPDAQSVWRYDAGSLAVTNKALSGLLIQSPLPGEGGRAIGASGPCALAVHGDRVYVSNSNNDTVGVFDARTLRPIGTVDLTPIPAMRRLRGVIPSAMAISKDGRRLYVCESGLNAVAAVDTATLKPLGAIPTGWFPNALALSPDERTLYIGTQKGLGRGPRGALNSRTDERKGLPEMPGMIDAVAVPDAPTLKGYTREVLQNNGLLPVPRPRAAVIPTTPGKRSAQIDTVVYIVKENHTFDGIYGDHPGADGQPEYAEFGRRGWIREKGKGERLDMMPNHHRLAAQFAMSQNFYMEPQASGDGHRWLVGVYPSLWSSRMFYAGWDFRASGAKGRLTSYGSNGSQIPEDYLENGSIWERLERGGVSFRNYGEGFEFPGVDEADDTGKSGAWEVANFPMPAALYKNTCFDFPIFNMNIPDVARVEWFKEDLAKYRRSHAGKIPRFLYVALCNDHGARPEPKRGYPYVGSWMADNDLALGRLVEHLTHQPEWKRMAIFVTQDDSGADDDHVDRHRSLVLAISPYARRGYLGKAHTSIMSIVRSIYAIFGLGPNNMFDALATPLDELFTPKADPAPYASVGVDPRLFDPKKAVDPRDPRFLKARATKSPVRMDDPAFVRWLRERR